MKKPYLNLASSTKFDVGGDFNDVMLKIIWSLFPKYVVTSSKNVL